MNTSVTNDIIVTAHVPMEDKQYFHQGAAQRRLRPYSYMVKIELR